MSKLLSSAFHRDRRPYTLLVLVIIVVAVVDHGRGYFLSTATAFSVMQLFATYGLVSLGLGLSLLVREFDISTAGMVTLAGAVAVLTGVANPWVGIAAALAVGLAGGAIQGLIMTYLNLNSVAVTVGGLLTFEGATAVLTGNQSISYPRMSLALMLNAPVGGVLSVRSAIVVAIFVLAALVMAYTRVGRDILATGGDRRGSAVAGVNTKAIMVGVFAASGVLCALSGAMLSYGLAAASPSALSDVLAPAAAGAIIGGVSLVGGRGRPMGIAAGVLVLCVLRSGLNAAGASSYVQDIATGCILLAVAVADAPELSRRLTERRLHRQAIRQANAVHPELPLGS
jgi:ribose/xylose/arabinose/galactoside ABC-type transport system permease subunit